MNATPVGTDSAKSVMQVHDIDPETGEIVNKSIKDAQFGGHGSHDRYVFYVLYDLYVCHLRHLRHDRVASAMSGSGQARADRSPLPWAGAWRIRGVSTSRSSSNALGAR